MASPRIKSVLKKTPYLFLIYMLAEFGHRLWWFVLPCKSPYCAGISEYEEASICGVMLRNISLLWKVLWVPAAALALILLVSCLGKLHTFPRPRVISKKLALIALALMLVVVLAVQTYFSFNLRVLLGDEDEYPKMAYYLATSGSFHVTWTGRSWFYPLIAGAFHWFYMKLYGYSVCYETEYLSISPQQWSCGIVSVRLLNTFLTALSIASTFCLASELYDVDVGVLSSLLVSANWNFLYWGARSVADISPTPFVLMSFLLLFKGLSCGDRRHIVLSGFLVGAAAMCRFPSAVFFATTLLLILAMKMRKAAFPYVAGFSVAMAIQALLDYVVYGVPFKSPWRFLTFNLNTEQVLLIQYSSPPEFFYYCLFAIFGPALYLVLIALLRGDQKTWFISANAFALALAHSLFIHKEARYMLAATPLLAMVIACGALQTASLRERMASYALIAAYFVYSILQLAWIACNNPYFWY